MTDKKERELRTKIQAVVMEFLEEHNHQRRMTLNELCDRICKADNRLTKQNVLSVVRHMAQIRECEALLDRIIIN